MCEGILEVFWIFQFSVREITMVDLWRKTYAARSPTTLATPVFGSARSFHSWRTWVSPLFQSDVFVNCYIRYPNFDLIDFHPKMKASKSNFWEISPIPFPEIDFPEETRLLWCVFVCFFLVENPWNSWNPWTIPANPANPPSSRMMAVLWRSSGEPARWRWEQVTGDRW